MSRNLEVLFWVENRKNRHFFANRMDIGPPLPGLCVCFFEEKVALFAKSWRTCQGVGVKCPCDLRRNIDFFGFRPKKRTSRFRPKNHFFFRSRFLTKFLFLLLLFCEFREVSIQIKSGIGFGGLCV